MAIAVVSTALPLRAYAGVSLQATVTATAGVTDNVANEPSKSPTNDPNFIGRQSDFLSVISPGLILSGGTPRAVQQLYYTFGGVLYGRHSEADTYTNTLSWMGLYLPSKTTRAGTTVSIVQGRTSAFNTALNSSGAQAQAQRAGAQNLLTVIAGETFAWDIAELWTLYQTGGYSTAYYIDAHPIRGYSQTVPATLTLEKRWQHSAASVQGAITWTDFFAQTGPTVTSTGAENPNGSLSPEVQQMIATPTAQYRRDFTYWLSGRAALGASVVFDPRKPGNDYVTPAAQLGFNFNTTRSVFDLSYQHYVSPNLLFASNFIADTAVARGTFLLSNKYNISAQLTLSYLYSQELNFQSQPEGHAHTVLADATLSWMPRPEVSFFVRYQLIDQIADVPGQQTITAVFPLSTFYRNTFLIGLTATYPPTAAVTVTGNTIGVRADHSDDAHIETSKSSSPQSTSQ